MADDRSLAVPATLSVAFPGAGGAADHTATFTLVSLAATGWLGTLGRPEPVTLRSSAAHDGTNSAELDALAEQMVRDWLAWRRGRAHLALLGAAPWVPDGHSEVEWEASADLVATRAFALPPSSGGWPGGGAEGAGPGGGHGGPSYGDNWAYKYDGKNDLVTYWHSSSAGTVYFLTGGLTATSSGSGGSTLVTLGGPTVLRLDTYLEVCAGLITCAASSYTININQNNYTPATWASVLPLNVTTDSSLTGLVPPDTTHTWTVRLSNPGSATLTLTNEDTSSTAAYRLRTATGGDLALPPGKTVDLTYNVTLGRWQVTGGTAVAYDRTVGTASISSSQNNYTITTPSPRQQWTITGTPTITGVVPPAGLKKLTITNTGAGTATIANNSGSSSAANRIITGTGGDISLGPNQTLSMAYDDATALWYVDGGSALATSASSLPTTPPSGIGDLAAVSTWRLALTITHADLTDADTQQDITVATLPAKASLDGWLVRTKTVGSGGGVMSLALNLLQDGTPISAYTTDGLSANNIQEQGMTAPTNKPVASWTATSTIACRFNCAGCNLADLTGGEWEVYLLLSALG